MATPYLYLLPVLPVGMMIISDFRLRRINVIWLTASIAAILCLSLAANPWLQVVKNTGVNTGLLIYMAIGAVIYFRIKTGKWVNPVNNYIGSGDILFLLAITPLMRGYDFLVFLIASMLFSLLWWAVMQVFVKSAPTIPFVGTLGISLCVYFTFKIICHEYI